MSPLRGLRSLWYALMALAVISAVAIAFERWADERRYVSVEICAEFESAVAHAAQLGYDSLPAYLRALKESGVVSVGVNEQTFAGLAEERGVLVLTGRELLARDALTPVQYPPVRELLDRGRIARDNIYIIPGDREFESLLKAALLRDFGPTAAVRFHTAGGVSAIEVSGDGLTVQRLQESRFGLPREDVQVVLDAGLRVVPRFTNPRLASPEAIDEVLSGLSSVGECSTVIFSGSEVLGYPDNLDYTALRFAELGISPGLVEFAVQEGSKHLAKLLNYGVVRVHSITPSEYPTLSAEEAFDRLVRAVSERNIRLLYLRPHLIEGLLSDGDALGFINSLRHRLESEGFVIGPARPFPRFSPSIQEPLLPVMVLGAIALGLSVILFVYPMSVMPQLALALVAGLAALAIASVDKLLARLLLSLGVAVVVPAVAIVVSVRRVRWIYRQAARGPVASAIRGWLMALCVSVAGGVVVAAILSDRSFFSKVTQFLGVKASHTLPFVLAGGLLWWDRYGSDFASGRMNVLKRIQTGLSAPIRLWHLVVAAAAAVGFVIYLGRTGNTFVVDIPAFDRWLRDLFETYLPVRPRTKEVFIGHPALIVSLYTYARSKGRCLYALAGVLVGTIGPISIINSFAHLHTPLAVTVMRVFLGAVLSLPVGLFGVWVANVLLRHSLFESGSARAAGGGSDDSEVCRWSEP